VPLHDHAAGSAPPPRAGEPSTAKIMALGGLLLLAALGLGGLYVFSERQKVATDPQTLCPTDRPVASVTVVLLDVSDRLTPAQVEHVRNQLERVRGSVPKFGLVEAYAVDPNTGRLSAPVVHLCNPGTAADANRVYQNPEFATKRWKEFDTRLSQSLAELMDAPSSEVSPIFEALQSLGLKTFEKPSYDEVPKRLVVVSDLLQNVPGKLNHYRDVPAFEVFRKTDYFAQTRAALDGVAVDVLYLRRSGVPTQGALHRDFWEQFFAGSNASLESFEQVYGDRQ
jgi:hypothetical protein